MDGDAFIRLRARTRPSPRTVLLGGMTGILAVLSARAVLTHLLADYVPLVDIEIPRRAAERWVAGQDPYLLSAFASPPGPTQPFLYPPFVLPLLALVFALPSAVAVAAWWVASAVAAVAALRRVGVPTNVWPLALLWPPIAEPLVGGNVQLLIFAAFAGTFYVRTHGETRDRAFPVRADQRRRVGILAAVVGAIKVSQPHTWLYLLRRDPPTAFIGAMWVVAIIVATLPLVGSDTWLDWIRQLEAARDPAWPMGGFALARFAPLPGTLVALAALLLVWRVPATHAGAWVGLLATAGALSLYVFGILFLIPAMLLVRREIALAAAIAVATYSYEGAWFAIIAVGAGMLGGTQYPWLLERGDGVRQTSSGRGDEERSSHPTDPVVQGPLPGQASSTANAAASPARAVK